MNHSYNTISLEEAGSLSVLHLIEMYNDAIMVKVIFPDKWKAYPSEDGRIKVTAGDNDKSLTYYYADSKDTTYEDMFDVIEETIRANNEIVLKLQLLKTKVEELKELFSQLPYDELKTIKFVTESVKTTKGRKKTTKKVKEAEKTQEVPQIENNEEEMNVEETKNE